MTFLKSFSRFWYDFVIGDDWKIAVAVVTALGLLVITMAFGWFGDTELVVLGGVLIIGAFTVSLVIDTRK
jgi:hypothetical protein